VTHKLPAAILWDMDGTLVDTEPYWLTAERELVHSYGGAWTHEDGLSLVGSGLWTTAEIFQGRGVELSADEIVHHLTDRVLDQIRIEVPWRPGAVELLAAVRAAGIRTALVTMSIRRMADYVVSAFDFPAFDIVVAGDDVTNPKPHPEPYLHAAGLLEIDIADAVVIEDSATGLASALASGAASIGVPLHVPLEEGTGHTIWHSLEGRTVDDLAAVFRDSFEVTA
jgi:HAD superfamily hydrolase (TIGR01509 family)